MASCRLLSHMQGTIVTRQEIDLYSWVVSHSLLFIRSHLLLLTKRAKFSSQTLRIFDALKSRILKNCSLIRQLCVQASSFSSFNIVRFYCGGDLGPQRLGLPVPLLPSVLNVLRKFVTLSSAVSMAFLVETSSALNDSISSSLSFCIAASCTSCVA